jgi:hypothetical protein
MAGNRHKPRDAYRSAGITNPRLIQLWIRGWELGRLGRQTVRPAPMPGSVIEGLVNADRYVRPGERVTLGELKRRVNAGERVTLDEVRRWADRDRRRSNRPGRRRGGW